MKKIFAILVALVLVVSLASCSKVSQKYADKVNKAAEAGECYTLAQVKEDLGDEAIEVIVPVINTGVVICDNKYCNALNFLSLIFTTVLSEYICPLAICPTLIINSVLLNATRFNCGII